MAETEEKIDFDHVNSQINGYPRDLLQRFIAGNLPGKFEAEERDLELSLGLSLNGQFGVDPNRGNKPIRSSSISDFTLTMNDYNRAARVEDTVVHAPLTRTCSLPTETEEGWKKRKEIQSFRRMEAKRKRLQKLRNGRGVREQVGVEIANGGVDFQALPTCQGSIGSGGSGSSGVSESESQPNQGINTSPEAKSPTSVHSQPKQIEQKPVATTGAATAIEKPVRFVGAAMENPSAVEVPVNNNKAAEITRNMMVDMPCVATRGIGPDGKRVEGFLYRYRKGEEVRIVCVCHGSFLSPAEFVKHAGGGDVAHPLKHIVVTPSSFL